MPSMIACDLQTEAELIERFVSSYRRQFAVAIAELNRHLAEPDAMTPERQCLRLCVETMDMMLLNQDRMARAMRRLAGGTSLRKAA